MTVRIVVMIPNHIAERLDALCLAAKDDANDVIIDAVMFHLDEFEGIELGDMADDAPEIPLVRIPDFLPPALSGEDS